MKIANLLTMLALMDEGSGPEPTGTIEITENGKHDVAEYAEADVNVPGIVPSGAIEITTNGTHDVTQYATANVNVPTVTPTGEVRLTQNNERTNVSQYASALVTVPGYNLQTLTVTDNRTTQNTDTFFLALHKRTNDSYGVVFGGFRPTPGTVTDYYLVNPSFFINEEAEAQGALTYVGPVFAVKGCTVASTSSGIRDLGGGFYRMISEGGEITITD